MTGSPALGRLSSREGSGRGGGGTQQIFIRGGSAPEVPDLVPSFIYPLLSSAHMYRNYNTRAVKANQVLLLVIKKVYFKRRGIGVVTVYRVYHLFA